MLDDIKAKLPFKKKLKEEEELDENEEADEGSDDATDAALSTNKTGAGDKTGETEIGDLDEIPEEGVSDETRSFVDKIKSKLIPKKKSDAGEDVGSAMKKAPKKKVNPVVLAIAAAVVIGLILYEEEPETPEVPVTSFKKPQRKKKTPPADSAPATETPAPETPSADTPATETPAPETPSADTAATETPAPEIPSADAPVTETPAPDSATIDMPSTDTTESEAPAPETPAETVDSSIGQTSEGADDISLTDKILEDLEKQVKKEQPKETKKEYIAAPDYEYRGRGLVYNCTGQHWACVDAPSYKKCEDNFSSTTYLKKKVECYPFNVYETVKGCELMQNRVVSSNAKTDFCNGN